MPTSTPALTLQHTTRAARLFIAITVGLLAGMWLANMGRVVHAAVGAPTHVSHASHIVVLGKRLSAGMVDHDFQARLDRAAKLMTADTSRLLLISGGGIGTSEAAAGLRQMQVDIGQALDPARIMLEEASSSTAENLFNIRQMLPENTRPVVISSRYHMARIARLATQSSMSVDLVAAETNLSFDLSSTGNMIKEAFYLTAMDLREIV